MGWNTEGTEVPRYPSAAKMRSRTSSTVPLVEYYARWSATGDKHAPKCHRISGDGTVEQVRDRILAALG